MNRVDSRESFVLRVDSDLMIVHCRDFNKLKQFEMNLYRPSRMDRRTDRTTMLLVAVLLLFLLTEFPQGILGLLSGIMGKWYVIEDNANLLIK